MSDRHYIFGYGSLINTASRRITGITGASIPVRVAGLQRHWVSSDSFPMSTVGVTKCDDGICNGVLFDVPAAEIASFDEREVCYERQSIAPIDIIPVAEDGVGKGGSVDIDCPIWVYLFPNLTAPTPTVPIAQSYLDIIMLGCLETSEAFAKEFIQSTLTWQHWRNDRHQPLYTRAIEHQHHQELDDMLAKELDEFQGRLPF